MPWMRGCTATASTATGEEELYVIAQDGSGKPEQLTSGGKAMRYQPEWAPDGKRIAFSDKDGKILVYAFDTKALTEIVDAPRGQVRNYTWSPKGNHLAFSMPGANGFDSIYIWSARDGQLRKITDEQFNAENPVWDPDGCYLFYLSDRDYAPQISTAEFNYATNRTTGVFAMALRKDVKHPFPPESDEVTVAKEEKGEPAKTAESAKEAAATAGEAKEASKPAEKKTDEKTADLTIDFDGLARRVARVPLEGDNYGGLTAKKGHLIYVVGPGFYYGRQSDRKPSLRIYALKDRKETTLVDDMNGYALSSDGSKLLVRSGQSFTLYDATPGRAGSKKSVSTSGLMVDRVPVDAPAAMWCPSAPPPPNIDAVSAGGLSARQAGRIREVRDAAHRSAGQRRDRDRRLRRSERA